MTRTNQIDEFERILAQQHEERRAMISQAKAIKLRKILTPERLQALLSDTYPRISAKVTLVVVPPAPPPTPLQRRASALYRRGFAKNESQHHSHLKWIGLNWCTGQSIHSESKHYRYEVQIAYPFPLLRALSNPGKTEVLGEGVVLPPRHQCILDNCFIKVADVYGRENIVECGDTDPSSLVLPLAARVASRVLWLPHPYKEKRLDWDDYSLAGKGLLIERSQLTQSAIRPADRYTLRTVKNGGLTVLSGDRNSRVLLKDSDTPRQRRP